MQTEISLGKAIFKAVQLFVHSEALWHIGKVGTLVEVSQAVGL